MASGPAFLSDTVHDPVEPTVVFRTKTDIVYEKLREQILSGELQAG